MYLRILESLWVPKLSVQQFQIQTSGYATALELLCKFSLANKYFVITVSTESDEK